MSNTCESFKIAEISDIHFGNFKISPMRTYEHLVDTLYPIFKDIQLLVINGDTFDTQLNMNSDAGLYVAKFIDDVINLAVFHNVFIRVVRGTFSHDRHQNRFFNVKDKGCHTLNGTPLVRVIDHIAIEHFKEMNINVMYCPDDQPHTDLNQAVIDVINTNHLTTVDLLFSHCYYEHLLPKGIPHKPHNTLSFDKLTKYVSGLMLNGHVHHSNVYQMKCITSGSFERLDHGNESDRVGFWLLTGTRSKKNKLQWKYDFKENAAATPFMTISADSYNSLESAQEDISNKIDDLVTSGYLLDEPIYIRILGNATALSKWIRDTYPNVIVTDKHIKTEQVQLKEELAVTSDDLPTITEDNLAQMIFDNLKPEDNLSLDEVKEIIDGL